MFPEESLSSSGRYPSLAPQHTKQGSGEQYANAATLHTQFSKPRVYR